MKSRLDNLVDRLYEIFAHDERDNPYVNCVTRASLASADDVSVFAYGKDVNPATKAFIERADEEVLMQFYNFDDTCEAGQDVKQALVTLNAKAANDNKNITVKVLVNYRKGPAAYFTKKLEDPFKWLQRDDHGIYFNIDDKKNYLNHLNIETKLHIHYYFDSYHSKQIIVDRKFLMLRSGDITKSFDCLNGVRLQTELATLIEHQQLAHHAATSFYERWNDYGPRFPKHCINMCVAYDNDDASPVLLLEKKASTNFINKLFHKSPYKIALIEGIRCAEKSVEIMTPNINDENIADEIIQALRRRVNIKLYTGKFANEKRESSPGMGGTNLDNILKIYESIPADCWDNFQVQWACDEEGDLILDGSPKMMHAKLVIIDDTAVLAGTSPLDKQAAFFSEESDMLIVSPVVAEKYLNIFEPAFAAGEDFNFHGLLNLKLPLARDLQKKFTDATLAVECEQDIQLQRIVFIDVLVNLIKDAENYGALMAILKLSLEVTEINPLAKISSQGIFASTKAIQALKKTYGDHGIRISNDGIYTNMRRISM